jgi:hypothetical protein
MQHAAEMTMPDTPIIIHAEADRTQDRWERYVDSLDDFYQRTLDYLRMKYHTYPKIPKHGYLTELEQVELAAYEQLAQICADTGLGQ